MWLLVAVSVFSLIWYYRRINKISILSRNGIPGNRPHLIYGNMFEMKGLSMVDKQKRLIEKYGKIVGYYTGAKPNVLVADPELVKNIEIKDFNNFANRSIYMRYLHPNPRAAGALVIARGQRWKQIRSLLSEAFTTSKLKNMTPIITESIDSFLSIIDKRTQNGEEFDIHELYQRLTLEMIIKSAFGIDIDGQNNAEEHPFVQTIHKYLEAKTNKLVLMVAVCFPELEDFILYLRGLAEVVYDKLKLYPSSALWRMCSHIIGLRKQSLGVRRNDILQAMLDTVVMDQEYSDLMNDDLTANLHQNEDLIPKVIEPKMKSSKKHIHLTEDEIVSNIAVFLGAGFDTSSNGMAFTTHFLVNYPHIQEKVREELKELFESEGKLDFNTVTKLQYLEWVVDEALRIYPPLVNGSTRECLADYKYKDITIPKGATVIIGTHFMHHDPEYWPEPEEFDPMRFSPERIHEINSSSWQLFGAGPRNCIGIRLAYLKMKLTLAKLLLNYRLEAGPNTVTGTLETRYKLLSVAPKNGVYVRAIKL